MNQFNQNLFLIYFFKAVLSILIYKATNLLLSPMF